MSSQANPALLSVVKISDPVQGKYIVVLKSGVQRRHLPYDDVTSWNQVLHGFFASLSQEELDDLRASPDVEAIYEDGYAEIFTAHDNVPLTVEEKNVLRASLDADVIPEASQDLDKTFTPLTEEELKEFRPAATYAKWVVPGTQHNAPWGLQRIIQPGRLANENDRELNFTYNWNVLGGSGVDVYVIDTGIDINRSQFGQRARWGATFGDHPNVDDHGHGTHCAGTVGSKQFGVAKQVSLIAVKVLGSNGRGLWSDIISGMNWVARCATITGRPSIASMSLGGSGYQPVDDAVANLTRLGVHVVVAAGNSNVDANDISPARAPSVNTVGAANIRDTRSKFSNYGSVLDLFAPGENIISTWGEGQNIEAMSGTSMACPHVSGTLALLISIFGNDTPAAWQARLKEMAVKNTLTDIPHDTPNLLLQASSVPKFPPDFEL